ncbi:hypothetical protein AWENTII_009689 [Aspergillus wentii]|nr:hypothetical protein MW887_006873 [Aspergillus wentii]
MTMPDIEQGQEEKILKSVPKVEVLEISSETPSKLQRWMSTFERISGLETRGIEHVPIEERQPPRSDDYLRIFLLWFSSSLTGNNLIVGLYGPSFDGLDLSDAAVCAVFGCIVGCAAVGYMSTWGPRSGNRTLIATQYFLGYHLSKLCCLLNILTMLGYGMVNCILGGQILFAVSGGQTAVTVGIAVVAILTWCIATFGMPLFHLYSRYAWIFQMAILCIMIGCAGPFFDTTHYISTDSQPSPSHRLSFFSLCVASAITWSPSSADYFVYFPPSTKRWKMFLAATTGMSLAMTLTTVLGVGLATGVYTNELWQEAALTSPGSLLATSFTSLRGFGGFCAIIFVLGMVSNNIPCTYSAGLNFQMLLGRHDTRIPRPLLTTIEVVIYTVCAILGHQYLDVIMEDFLPLMSYWIVIWLAICLEEEWIFKRGYTYDWSSYNAGRLPKGLAAGFCFLIGCIGAIMGMVLFPKHFSSVI